MKTIREILQAARSSARVLAISTGSERKAALESIGRLLEASADSILVANSVDLTAAREGGLSPALLDRLSLDRSRVLAMVASVRDVASLPDPLGQSQPLGNRPNGLRVERRRIPLGVLAVIYEARPNVTVEAACLAIKSGNAIVLRGGREAMASNRALVRAVQAGLAAAGLPESCVQWIEDPSRERIVELLGAVGQVDLAIPRGGAELMKLVDACARVPVIRHGQGITHVFLDADADPSMAAEIVFNSKVQRPGVCNALETLLVHRDLLTNGTWVVVADRLARSAKVELRVDELAAAALVGPNIPHRLAHASDWDTEFLSLTLAVRSVASLDEALVHIADHGTRHTASIVTGNRDHAERFLREVDASCVLWNASTRFNDGGELGLGSEMGISTTKIHAFGPMGLRELTTEKYVVYGTGQVRQ
jgi:glutamate-5-semialdehyde dehydrogenase